MQNPKSQPEGSESREESRKDSRDAIKKAKKAQALSVDEWLNAQRTFERLARP
jgi:hypothetical protein